ncbi:MAG: PHP domain-containing protein [Bacteroidales bacterium]
MKLYKADLHTHTVLSPCGDLEMSPRNIVARASARGMHILGITDHNSTRQCQVVQEAAKPYNLMILAGAEVTSKEEAHCLAFFESAEQLAEFQLYLDEHLPNIPNDPDKFGYQVVVNLEDDILYQEERLLISAIDQNVDQISAKVHELNGLFIPAHVNRARNSLIGQLGFVPFDLAYDALELSKHITYGQFIKNHAYLDGKAFIQSSDAHFIEDIGSAYTQFYMEEPSFEEIRLALHGQEGRKVALAS